MCAQPLRAPPIAGERSRSSRLPGIYSRSIAERLDVLEHAGWLSPTQRQRLECGECLPLSVADRLTENVIGIHGLPLSIAPNFVVNGRETLLPMAVEEPSIVAAASHAALLARAGGGFQADADPPIMTTQIQLTQVPDPHHAAQQVLLHRDEVFQAGNARIPRMVQRGGGCRDLEVLVLDPIEGMLVVNLYVDVRDAMGANIVDGVAEAIAPVLQSWIGGRVGLRILSNLPLRRLVRARVCVPSQALPGGLEAARGIVLASRFAELDPLRAATHNKGIMNGIDAVAVALGQDWRSIEAAAHAFAGLGAGYRPLSSWQLEEDRLLGRLELPLAVGVVGGIYAAHPGVRLARELIGATRSGELAEILACVGLATNLAALKALSGEGIQRGHMALHHRKGAAPGGAT